MEPRYNEGQRNWKNSLAITRFRYIEVIFIYFTIAGVKKSFVIPRTSLYRGSLYLGSLCGGSLYRGFRYIEVRFIEVR